MEVEEICVERVGDDGEDGKRRRGRDTRIDGAKKDVKGYRSSERQGTALSSTAPARKDESQKSAAANNANARFKRENKKQKNTEISWRTTKKKKKNDTFQDRHTYRGDGGVGLGKLALVARDFSLESGELFLLGGHLSRRCPKKKRAEGERERERYVWRFIGERGRKRMTLVIGVYWTVRLTESFGGTAVTGRQWGARNMFVLDVFQIAVGESRQQRKLRVVGVSAG